MVLFIWINTTTTQLHITIWKHLLCSIESLQKSIVLLIPCFNILQGTGKTYTGTKLVYLFDKINSRMQEEGHAKMQLVFCGPNNKSVDLVASKCFPHIRYQVRVIYWLICGRLYMLSMDQDDLGLSKVQLYHFSRIPFWFMWVSLRTRYWVSWNGDKKNLKITILMMVRLYLVIYN